MGDAPDTERTERSASPAPLRRRRSAEGKSAVSKEVFTAEIFDYLANVERMYAGAHGDHVVAVALVNPLAHTASPRVVMAVLVDAALPAGELWNRFKAAGGISKEIGDVDESQQLDAIRGVWTSLHGASDLPRSASPTPENASHAGH